MSRSETAGEALAREDALRAAIGCGEAAAPKLSPRLRERLAAGGQWASAEERAEYLRYIAAGGVWSATALWVEEAWWQAQLAAEGYAGLPVPERTPEAWECEARAYFAATGRSWDPRKAERLLDTRRPVQEASDADSR